MKTSTLSVLFCALTIVSSRAAEAPKRPNVVLIIADDMAWDDCGAYGNPNVKTPHIDRLAREGMRFDRAFVTASSCSPSRSSMITGPLSPQHRRRGAALAAAAGAGHVRREAEGVRLLDRRRRKVAPGQCRQRPVRRDPRGRSRRDSNWRPGRTPRPG